MPKSRKPTAKKNKKKTETPQEDVALWHAVTQTVEPLGPVDMLPEISDVPLSELLAPLDKIVKPRSKTGYHGPVRKPQVALPVNPLPELSHQEQPGLDKATAKRMRRGQVNISGRIDLHGLTQAEAHRALDAFLEAAWYAKKREVLVITGKGTRADGSIGVLRQAVPRWLNAFPNRAKVVAFSYAASKDGGEGALYVRLKKHG